GIWPKMAQQGFDGILFWPDYTLMFITSEDHREREAESWPEFERERSFPAERERWPGGEKAERRWSKG
ncbi:hypothetical protein HID58_074947, partial [Brassica napus]